MLNPDFKDMLSVFSEERVEYMVVGAYALAAHGFVRATGDIDLWIRCSGENAERVMRALIKFGAPLFDLTAEDIRKPGLIFQIGVVPRRIDILTSVDGLEFDEAWSLRKEVIIEKLKVPVISRSDLLRNKRAAGRPKDKADVAWLESSEK
ncbi:MAG: hypothetical protein GY795_15015 [Desulfobacterales bacterium]|nr:hypothetical protein [Desulfobacterales bacterium]